MGQAEGTPGCAEVRGTFDMWLRGILRVWGTGILRSSEDGGGENLGEGRVKSLWVRENN
jgi:hypothetical protein